MWNALALAVLSQAGPASSGRDLLALAPADCWAVVTVDDLSDLRAAIARSAWTELLFADGGLADLAMAPDAVERAELDAGRLILGVPFEGAEAARAALEAEQRDALEVIEALDGGAVAWIGGTWTDEEPLVDIGLALETGAPGAPLAAAVLSADAGWSEHELDGVLWQRRTAPDGMEIALAELDGVTALVASHPTRLDASRAAFVARLRGDAGVADARQNPRRAEALSTLETRGQVELFVDLAQIAQRVVAEGRGVSEAGDRALDRMGVEGISWFAARLGIGEGARTDFEWALHLPPKSGLAELADLLRPAPMDLLARVPADAVLAGFASYDLPGLYDTGIAIAESIHPGSSAIVESSLALVETQLGLSPRSDVLDLVEGTCAWFVRETPGPVAEGWMPDVGVVAGVADGATLAGSLEALHELALAEDPSVEAAGIEWAWSEGPTGEIAAVSAELPGGRRTVAAIGPRVLAFGIGAVDPIALAAPAPQGAAPADANWAATFAGFERSSVATIARTGPLLDWLAQLARTTAELEGAASEVDPELAALLARLPHDHFTNRLPGTAWRSLERIPLGLRGHSGSR